MIEDTITSAIDFFEKIKDEGIVKVKFIKKDGSLREMLATLDFNRIPKKDRPKKDLRIDKIIKLLAVNKIIHVYDLEKLGWRSIPYENVEYLQTPTKLYKVNLKL